jgi:hypothetical protein
MLWEDVKASEEKPPVRHPNRDLPESQTARLGIVALLVLTFVMLLVVALGGWSLLVGAKIPLVVFAIIYAGFAYYVSRWNRGVLPVIAGLAVILAVFALVAGPDWFARDKVGYNDPSLPAALLGVVTLALIPVQMLLVVVSMWGFNQQWNVEEEIHPDEPDWPADRPRPAVTPPQPPPAAAPAS